MALRKEIDGLKKHLDAHQETILTRLSPLLQKNEEEQKMIELPRLPDANRSICQAQECFTSVKDTIVVSASCSSQTSLGDPETARQSHTSSPQRAMPMCPPDIEGASLHRLSERPPPPSTSFGKLVEFVDSTTFEAVFGVLIVLNAFTMAAHTQYVGIGVGHTIEYKGSHGDAKTTWPGADEAFSTVEWMFGIIFVCELVLKVLCLQTQFVRCKWNLMDFVIVLGWIMDAVLGVSTFINPMILRLVRLAKLLRVAKLFKTFKVFDSLSILIGSMHASLSVLFWSVVLIVTVQLAASLLFSQVLRTFILEEDNDKETRMKIYEYFGTFTRSFLTMFELTLGNWVPVCRMLSENVNEYFAAIVMVYVLCITFAVIKVITAVFIFETQKVAQSDEELLILQKERASARLLVNFHGIFTALDDSGDGLINRQEFDEIMEDHRVKTWLSALDLDVEHCEKLFKLLDSGDGKISFQEFVHGVQQLKGTAKAVDLIAMQHQVHEILKNTVAINEQVQYTRS